MSIGDGINNAAVICPFEIAQQILGKFNINDRHFSIFVCLLTFFFVFDLTGVSSSVIAELQTKNDKAKIKEHGNAVLYRAFRYTIVVPTQVIAFTLILFVIIHVIFMNAILLCLIQAQKNRNDC